MFRILGGVYLTLIKESIPRDALFGTAWPTYLENVANYSSSTPRRRKTEVLLSLKAE